MSATQNIDEVVKTASTTDLSVLSLIANSDLVGKSVILILLIASVWSWAIIIDKYFKFKNIKAHIKRFEKNFWSGQVLDELYEKTKQKIDSPMAQIFISGMEEFKRKTSYSSGKVDSVRIGRKERISQAMNLVRNRELEALESKLGFLATVGSSAVFIGLFGTVWGIIHSFQSIATAKNTSLAVVAPGIAEALVATAIGLFVAIPAVIFYNYLISEIDTISSKLDDFAGELYKLLSRAIDDE